MAIVDQSEEQILRDELAELEAQEHTLSSKRRMFHHRMDFFAGTSRDLPAMERELSNERRELHRRIDALRALLADA